jgi:nucleotide-binding universal stress UspA family protein
MSEPDAPLLPLRKIIVAVDGSENARRAASAAIEIAKKSASEVVMLTIISIPTMFPPTMFGSTPSVDPKLYEAAEREGKKLIQQLVETAKSQGVNARGELLRSVSSAVAEIVKSAENEKADLIVIGTRGLGGFQRLLMGSVSSGVVTHAHCAVLVVR